MSDWFYLQRFCFLLVKKAACDCGYWSYGVLHFALLRLNPLATAITRRIGFALRFASFKPRLLLRLLVAGVLHSALLRLNRLLLRLLVAENFLHSALLHAKSSCYFLNFLVKCSK